MAAVESNDTALFERFESNVRSYSRAFPTVMSTARDAVIRTESGRELVDFLSGAGALNYGHNPTALKRALTDYVAADGIIHALDLWTPAKRRFIEIFNEVILAPRGLTYKYQFPGPTGANAIEAAFKLARKVTGRHLIAAFTNAFHGVSLGAVAATANSYFRGGAGLPLLATTFLAYDGYHGADLDTAALAERYFADGASGFDKPAAFVVETVQGEGGINVASIAWLRRIAQLANKCGALLIVDDVQMGCGRTGSFFSFDRAGIQPDIVVLSKSLSGYGLPLSLLLMRPELDVWLPGQHNGTFRGNNLALVAAAAALEEFWSEDTLEKEIRRKGAHLLSRARGIALALNRRAGAARGLGMAVGIDVGDEKLAARVARIAFEQGLIIERCGPREEVLKLFPPLTITDDVLERGLDVLASAAALAVEDETTAEAQT